MKTIVPLLVLFFSTLSAHADWKTFLHGKPAAAVAGPPDAKAATITFAPEVPTDPQILEFLQAFAEAMRVHDGKSLRPRLSEKYTSADLPDGHDATDLFMQGMVKVKAPDEIVITSIAREGEVRTATTEFRSPEKVKTRTFKFDPAGKLLSADFFKLEVHGHGF